MESSEFCPSPAKGNAAQLLLDCARARTLPESGVDGLSNGLPRDQRGEHVVRGEIGIHGIHEELLREPLEARKEQRKEAWHGACTRRGSTE
jgi:hypothetical protein